MDEKIEILQCLIDNHIFAPSTSALAKILGYKGKMTLYRLMQGTVSEKLVNGIWNKLLSVYSLEDTTLYALARICYMTKVFNDHIQTEMNTKHPEWVENVIRSLVEDFYDYYSDTFRKNIVPVLKEMKKEEPNILWGMVMLFYLRAKKIEPYTKDGVAITGKVLFSLDKELFSLHPENIRAHQAAANLISVITSHEQSVTVWELLYNGIILFRYYTEADFLNVAVKSSILFDWPARSYWIVPGTTYQQGACAWLLVAYNPNDSNYGFYMALHLEMGENTEEFQVLDCCILQFLFPENILCLTQLVNRVKIITYYNYEYNSDNQTLSFVAMSNDENQYKLPEMLCRINLSSPDGKDEKIWSRIFNRFDKEGKGRDIYMKTLEDFFEETDFSDSYKIEDVIISCSSLSLIVNHLEKRCKYQIPTESYAFLSEINPSQRIAFIKHNSDGELYVEWPDLGYGIKLSEFTQIE